MPLTPSRTSALLNAKGTSTSCVYGNNVILNWIPGHADQKGNEVADRMVTSRITFVIPVSRSVKVL